MKSTTTLAAATLLALLPLSVSAQDTQAPATEGEAPAAPAEPAAGGQPSTGEGAAPAPAQQQQQQQQAEVYVREEHGDFEVRCLRAPEGQADPCQLFQRMNDAGGNPTADINFFDLPDGNELVAGATVLTPLQTLLTAQVTLTIDGGEPRRYPFAFCDAAGCYARLGFTEADVNQMRRGAAGKVVVVPALAPDQPAELTLSLTGFTAGMAAIEVPNAAQ